MQLAYATSLMHGPDLSAAEDNTAAGRSRISAALNDAYEQVFSTMRRAGDAAIAKELPLIEAALTAQANALTP